MTEAIIFYSWQSDLPNKTNRGFIQNALEQAVKAIKSDESIEVQPVIDRDTSGVPGSPNISETIFSKIDKAAAVVCDVSIILENGKRPVPNPNVLIELGYALKSLGWKRVLLVVNTAHGPVESLPFDLRQHRVIPYNVPSNATPEIKESQRKQLASTLKVAIETILTSPVTPQQEVTLYDRCLRCINNNDKHGWLSLLDDSGRIPDLLVNWKHQWEAQVYEQLSSSPPCYDALLEAFIDAVKICLSGFTPIFCAVEHGHVDFWNSSSIFLRGLSRLEEKLLGGPKIISNIVHSLLSVAGSIGIAIAVKYHQFELIKRWSHLKLSLYSNRSDDQNEWIELHEVNWPYVPFDKKIDKPFSFLKSYYDKSEIIQKFFTDSVQLEQFLLAGNLSLSLLEFGHNIIDPRQKNKLSSENSDERILPNIYPVWGTMERHTFLDQTERMFPDPDELLPFCNPAPRAATKFPKKVSEFWTLWKSWKRMCLERLGDYGRHVRKMNTLLLPGEPVDNNDY